MHMYVHSCAQFSSLQKSITSLSHWSLIQSRDNADFLLRGSFASIASKTQVNAGPRRGSITQAPGSSIKT